MGGRAEIFQLLRSEDVDGDEMDLGMPVLASLGSAHFDNFAGTTFDHHKAVLPQGGALHRIGRRCASISAIESVLMLLSIAWVRKIRRGYWAQCGDLAERTWASSAIMQTSQRVSEKE